MRLFVIAPALTLMTASLVLGWGKMPPVNQSRTLTELKYQEVLRNLAMMHRRNLARGAGVGPEVSAGPTPNGVSPPFVLQIDYLVQSECDALAPLPGDELRPRAPVLEPQRLLLLEYAYQKALGFRFDIPVEEKMAAFFGPRARLYAALQARWYCIGEVTRVPSNAIYIGEYDGLSAWVYAYNLASLAEFTRALEYIVNAPLPPPGSPPPRPAPPLPWP